MTYGRGRMTYNMACNMVYRRARWLWPVVLIFLLILAARPASARPAPASEQTVTLLSVGPGALQVQGADGRAFAVPLTPATWVLGRGEVVPPGALVPGETLRVRLGRGKSGAALLVCDAETAEALDSHRRRPLTGTLARVDGPVWTVQPADSAVPLPVCLSARTTFGAGDAPVSASAFGAGASVTITTRGLANGLLTALSVSAAVLDPPAMGTAAKSKAATGKAAKKKRARDRPGTNVNGPGIGQNGPG